MRSNPVEGEQYFTNTIIITFAGNQCNPQHETYTNLTLKLCMVDTPNDGTIRHFN